MTAAREFAAFDLHHRDFQLNKRLCRDSVIFMGHVVQSASYLKLAVRLITVHTS